MYMKKKVDLVVVISVGPNTNVDFLKDTVDSAKFYINLPYVLIIIEDFGTEIGSSLLANYPFLKILKSPGNSGLDGGLYVTLSQAYDFAFENYDFKVLLKLDTDALVIGESPEKDAICYFEKHPDIGQLGSYKFDCNDDKRDYTYPKNIIKKETDFKRIFRNRSPIKIYQNLVICITMRKILKDAIKNGYEYGEHCLGGGYFISYPCVQRLIKQKRLQIGEFRKSKLGEDHIFGLLIRSVGFRIGDFATGTYPIGMRHRGLPCSPSKLIQHQKKLVHSTRFWENMDEEEIRIFFKKHRDNQ